MMASNGMTSDPDLDELRRNCGYCAIHDFQLPVGLSAGDLHTLNASAHDMLPLDRGQTLFPQGRKFSALYVVRAGALKTFVEGSEGDVQILGFHLPGDIMGIGGLINEQTITGTSGIPLLSKIPVLGALFGTQSYNRKRTELVLIITPRIVSDSVQAREATLELRKKLPALESLLPKPKDLPIPAPVAVPSGK